MGPIKHRNSSFNDVGGNSRMPPSVEDPNEYYEKRARNNVAVKKSREKSRQKQREVLEKVTVLRRENEELEMRVTLLSKELQFLRNLFLEHAGASGLPGSNSTGNEKSKNSGVSCKEETVNLDVSEVVEVNTIAAKKDHEYSTTTPTKRYASLS